MKGLFHLSSALQDWENPPELPEAVPTLPTEGKCPFCKADLEWDGIDDTRAWCTTTGCAYDPSKSEESNRRDWLGGKR